MTTIIEYTSGAFSGSSSLLTGTANTILSFDGSGATAYLTSISTSLGGTGQDSSAWNGVVKVAAGVWSASAIVNADIDANAAIAWTKMATLTANSIVTTDGSGYVSTTVEPLGLGLGGTGLDLSTITQFRILASNSAANALDVTLAYSATAVANNVVQRDGSSGIAAPLLTSAADITLSPTSGLVQYGANTAQFSPATGTVALVKSTTVTTTNNTATAIYSLVTAAGAGAGTSYGFRGLLTFGTAAGTAGTMSFLVYAKNIGGTLTVSPVFQISKAADNALNAATVTATGASQTLNINVVGLAATTIVWGLMVELVSQSF